MCRKQLIFLYTSPYEHLKYNMEKRFELLMCACKRENMLKFVFSGNLSEPYNKIFNNDCLFYITVVGKNIVSYILSIIVARVT